MTCFTPKHLANRLAKSAPASLAAYLPDTLLVPSFSAALATSQQLYSIHSPVIIDQEIAR